MKIVDWDCITDRRYTQFYFGSHKLCDCTEDIDCRCKSNWGRDFFFQFLGLHLYLAMEWEDG